MSDRARVRNKLRALAEEVDKLPDAALAALRRSGVLDEAILAVRGLTALKSAADLTVGDVVRTLARHAGAAIATKKVRP